MMISQRLKLHIPSGGPYPATNHVEIQGTRTSALRQAHSRLTIVNIFFMLAYMGLSIRAFDLMIIQGALSANTTKSPDSKIMDISNQKTTSENTPSIPRRDIVDRNGILLTTSIRTTSLYADPKSIINPEETARALSAIFADQSYGEILKKLEQKNRFVWIKRNLTPREQASILELGDPGLNFKDEFRRLYPQGNLTAHVIGYSGIDSQGLAGIEGGFNDTLSKKGGPLELSIDVRLQHVLHRELQKTMTDFTAQAGAGLIMNVKTGEVLALTSLPDYDPHAAAIAKDEQKFNRVTLGTYELGSTFKIFTTAALLEGQHVPLSTTFDTRNPIKVGRFTISDYHPENRPQTIPEVFMHSSNIGTAMMAQQIGTENLKNFFDDLGLLQAQPFDLPESGKPLIPRPWKDVSTLTASYGHGIAVTPLHLASATATIIGDGRIVIPKLIKSKTSTVQKGDQIVSKETVQTMRNLLRLVVQKGTGSKADVPGLLIGGKTGTAEKSINGRYVHNALITTFIGAFPMNNPEYIILVTVDDPKPNKSSYGYATAGWTAAPATARIAENMVRILGIVPDMAAKDPADKLHPYLKEEAEKIEKETANQNLPVHQKGGNASDEAQTFLQPASYKTSNKKEGM